MSLPSLHAGHAMQSYWLVREAAKPFCEGHDSTCLGLWEVGVAGVVEFARVVGQFMKSGLTLPTLVVDRRKSEFWGSPHFLNLKANPPRLNIMQKQCLAFLALLSKLLEYQRRLTSLCYICYILRYSGMSGAELHGKCKYFEQKFRFEVYDSSGMSILIVG